MNNWNKTELKLLRESDDLHIAPLRADGKTFGTPTWIWSVVVDDCLYVRAYNGVRSRWYQSAITQLEGRIHFAGMQKTVSFEKAAESLNEQIDTAYREKYGNSPYLDPMTGKRSRAATVRITPKTGDLYSAQPA